MAKQKSRFPSYGLVRGPSHEGGGVAGMVAGEQPVELEGGEWIIPKEAVPDYLPVLKQITNQGRAMQQMQNGNSAMDALIASATMEVGVSQPKSPMYKSGGHVCHKCGKYQEGGQVCASGECAVPEIQNQMGMFSMPYQGQKIDIDLLSAMEGIKSSEYLASNKAGEYFMMPSSDIPADSLKSWYSQMEGVPDGYQKGGKVPENFLTRLRGEEGSLPFIYKDSLGKPTGGTGHLMTEGELKDYGVAKYIDHDTIYGPRKVAVDANDNIINLGADVTGGWLEEDSKKAYNAALSQVEELGIDSQEMINALGSVNFQLGTGWRGKGKFPGVWKAMKDKEYGLAAENVQWVNPDEQQVESDWYKQTKPRAEKFMETLRGYKKRRGGPIYQDGGQVKDVLSIFGEKSESGDEMQRLMTMAAMQQMQGDTAIIAGKDDPYGVREGGEYMKIPELPWDKKKRETEEYKAGAKMRADSLRALNPDAPWWNKPQDGPIYQNGGRVYDPVSQSLVDQTYYTPEFRDSAVQSGSSLFTRPRREEYGELDDITAGMFDAIEAEEAKQGAYKEKHNIAAIGRDGNPIFYGPQGGIGENLLSPEERSPLPAPSDRGQSGALGKIGAFLKGINPWDKGSFTAVDTKQQGGPIYQKGGEVDKLGALSAMASLLGRQKAVQPDGRGGQMQPRKQQEVRRSIDPGFYVSPQQVDMDSLLKQMMMRDVNQATGNSNISTVLDSMKMQQGGPVGGQPLERGSPPQQAAQLQGMGAGPQNSLMSDAGQDGRIQAIPPDKYIIKDGTRSSQTMEIPKLSSAYMQSFGLETPLSKRQQSFLQHRAIAPETLNPQVKSLLGRALVQRLTNEPI